ncbi:hypothetical protein BDZ45DRAFT_610618 [Acephala macrosclerotiorum]|nr:hypothetical protein BDZ45DRAFT_610618 [Acephala macrosclerotiorum]
MTRHNLDSHISWLLSHKVTFPATVYATNSAVATAAEIVEEEFLDEEDTLQEVEEEALRAAAPARENRVQTNVAQEFIRPPLPSSKPQIPDITSADGFMGKLSSSSKPTRPGLMTQNQLATPASTSGTTSSAESHLRTGSRGLAGTYAAQLREERNGTPSARSVIDRSLPRFPQPFQTPQTPRQTPRPTIDGKIKTIESVDLTGDDQFADPPIKSSSSDAAFGSPITLWREDSASRAEPPTRTSKKRKSGDLSPERIRRPFKHKSERIKASQSQQENLDSFIDIDDLPKRPATKTPSSQVQHQKFVKPSVELEDGMDGVEEYQVTETISTIQTRTRKSISRVPSFTGEPPGRSRQATYESSSRAIEPPRTNETPRTTIQVAASPALRLSTSPETKHVSSPQRPQKRRLQKTIQDSEDEGFSDAERKASCSPRTPTKASPRIVKASASPTRRDPLAFSPSRSRAADFNESKPRVGSPLRPISRNVAIGRNHVHSPFHRDSPTKLSLAPETYKPQSDQQTPSSSLGLDDKKLVGAYLKNSSLINLYQTRVINLLSQNALASMAYFDKGQPPPSLLKEERTALLDMQNAYEALSDSQARHKSLADQKKLVARQISEMLETDLDASHLESQFAKLTQDIQKLEKEIARLLYDSGAVKDGFGTGLENDVRTASLIEPSTSFGAIGSLPTGSNTTTNPHVILQTQLPSFQSRITASYDERIVEIPSRSPSTNRGANTTTDIHQTNSPLHRQNLPQGSSFIKPKPYAQTAQYSVSTISRQPNFYRDPSPTDYDFDGEEFNDLLDEEPGFQIAAETRNEIAEMIEDEDFGDSGDDKELLEAAQDFEKRQSFTKPPIHSRRPTTTETAWSTSENDRNREIVGNNMYSNVDLDQSDMFRHPWSNDVKTALKRRFKMNGFRIHQLDVINTTLGGEDAFVLMPTGGGKSLCFQLPGIIQSGKTKGVTIVISPLLSLMQDQVDHLQALNIRAGRISSDISAAERKRIMSYLDEEYPEQFIQLLYISPEMINQNQTFLTVLSRLHRNKKLARIVIDEAHCVSQWGHEFRPDYVALKSLRGKFPGVPLIALTATATQNVKVDVMSNLRMEGAKVFAQSFNRPNLLYEVRSKNGNGRESVDEIASMIKDKYKGQSGIIYTLSRVGCEKLAEKLKDKYGIAAAAYHGQMEPQEKIRIQKEWQSGQLQVVVATIAFGMGIDKKDVRFVVHYTIPKSLEGYYQETGRAGRDGKRAGCYLYYAYGDTMSLKKMIFKNMEKLPQEKLDRQWEMLKIVIQFCENKIDCRRQLVLAYFGENFDKRECRGTCDNCWSDVVYEPTDVSKYARAALQLVAGMEGERVTSLHCVDILRGANLKKIRDAGHDKLKEFGAGKNLARGDVERLFNALAQLEAIAEESIANKGGYANTYIKLGQKARDYLRGKVLKLNMPSTKPLAKRAQKSRSDPYPSTAVTSPLAPSSRKNQPAKQRYEEDDDVESDNFIAPDSEDEENAFERMPARGRSRLNAVEKLGPPITLDDRMAALSGIHRDVIHQFVDEAKKLEERIRNKTSARKPFFTEANLREMVIRWTLTLGEMRQIPEINVERVNSYGEKFLPLIKRFHSSYNAMMETEDEQDIDPNHQDVIDLVTDDEGEEDGVDEEFEIEEGLEEALLRAEASPYFQPEATTSKGKGKAGWKPRGSRGGYKARGNGKKSYTARKSNGSTSGQSNGAVRKRTSSGGSKRGRGSSSGGSLRNAFANQSGRSGGGGGGIGMMPT